MIQLRQLAALCTSLVVLALTSGAGHATAAPKTPELALTYDVSVYGVRAMRWEVELTRGADDYATQFQARASGLPSLISDLAIHARAGGRQDNGQVRPRSYTSRYLEDDEKRSVLIAYGPDGPIMTRARPSAQQDDRELVPQDVLRGARDPLTGAYELLRKVVETGTCQGDLAIFDGRRLFQLSLLPAGDADPGLAPGKPSSDAPPQGVMQCRAELDKVAGFKPKERRDNRYPDELLIDLAPVGPDGDLLPVRLTAKHHVGPVSITLADVRVGSETAGAPRADTLAWASAWVE